MPTFLSPGVFTKEVELGLLSPNTGPTIPVFVGTAKKGPMNVPTFCDGPQQAVDKFGEAFPESYLMYGVLSYAGPCFIVRVGVEYEVGIDEAIADISIDTSGSKVNGWGRIPLFTGIDYGRITLRQVSSDAPFVFHAASVGSASYNDQDTSSTDGVTTADLNFSGATDLSSDYDGSIDDSFIVLITGSPSSGEVLDGATFEVIRNSDSEIVADGTLVDSGSGTSQAIDLENGVVFNIEVTEGALEEDDTFTFQVVPDNRVFSVSVEGGADTDYTIPAATYTDVSDFVDALNVIVASEDYLFVEYVGTDGVTVPQIRTDAAGRRIQLLSTDGFALEVGVRKYEWDIPRSYLIGTAVEPYQITSRNNRATIQIIPNDVTLATKVIDASVANSLSATASDIADNLALAGVVNGKTYFDSFSMTVPGGTEHVVIIVSLDNELDQLKLSASYSSIKTLRFSQELGFLFPYTTAYRGFNDARVELPGSGEVTPETPLSCEVDSSSDECATDAAYFENVVGWLVATSPGVWIDSYRVSLQLISQGVGDLAGRYQILIKDAGGSTLEIVNDVSFDKTATRYIGNVLNPGSTIGGVNGHMILNWEERPTFLANDPVNDLASYVVRQPSQLNNKEFAGSANGIPTDPAYSSELDTAVIGNSAESKGIFAVQNSETYNASLLMTPGFSSGSVIGQCLQLCEDRGDMFYLADPPFGLRPEQVVDWHNGMFTSDVSAAINSSYGALYWSWLEIADQFSRQNIWIPPSGYAAAAFAKTSKEFEIWNSPAGTKRGRILTALDVEYNPSLPERDLLQGGGNSVNPILKLPKRGITIYGARTLQRTESLTSHIGVRILLNDVKKKCVEILNDFVFEQNDQTTWRQVAAVLNPYLSNIQSRGGLDGFKVVVDESNNTPERRDKHQLWVSVFIKPTPDIEFVVFNLVSLRSSQSFAAEEVLIAGGVVLRS